MERSISPKKPNIVFRLLSVSTGLELPTDRDNFKYKRVELVGSLMYDLFREYYTIQQKYIFVEFDKRLNLNRSIYGNDLPRLIDTFKTDIFKKLLLEDGFKRAFKGNWGSKENTKRIGVVQDLNRLSFNSYLSHLRKTNLPLDSSVKLVGPRVLHGSQWGFIDPIDTPDGGNIGLHKSLAISTYVTRGGNGTRGPMIQWLRENISLKRVEECSPNMLSEMTRVMVNGYWAGSIMDPFDCVQKIKLYRRNALLPIYTSVTFEIKLNTIFIYTDGGRLCRPIFYKDELTKKLSFEKNEIMKTLKENNYSWADLITGFNHKRQSAKFNPNDVKIYELHELYDGVNSERNPAKLERFLKEKAIIDFIDSSESENTLIAVNQEEYSKNADKYTNMEIHESLIFGTMCNLIIFPENNPPTRNSFSCGQSKQACSMYHTNHQVRMDKTAVVLNNGQIPLVKSRYMEYINHEETPYGENAIVAIMCYTGYNVEDAVLINEGALKRGLFNTTYYSTYESHEEINKNLDVVSETKFTNIESDAEIVGTKSGYDYSKLDNYGLIKEGTEIDDKTVLIGISTSSGGKKIDASKTPKKGQLGIVDKTFITEGEEGERIAKVRIREQRIPNLGDKLASRAGQKGTVGLVVPECDMPFTKDGIRPDIIINPHAIPSRMTIGQLVECVIGKACSVVGGFGDCTAFVNKGSKIRVFGEILTKVGYHSSGNEVLYNGMTGEQIESEIFIGPTYYMRLKHMVKDKINYRARGPMTSLTKQPVSGRANDGGLRIGEMERDSIISHGAVNFLTESMMERGDKYHIAVCNTTGMLAIYNPSKNIFLSPMADGPIQFTGTLDGKEMNIENVTKFGRDFSVVSVPYTMKLLIQELQCINVQMRIITEDNIQQLEQMSFSKNIEKLIGTDGIARSKIELKKDIQIKLYENKSKMNEIESEFDNVKINIQESEPNLESIPFATGSPAFNPDTLPNPPSNIGSPAFNPNTPPANKFEPRSPSMSPPANLTGGKKKLEEDPGDFQDGEIVFYRGEQNPSEYQIIKVGNNFITIQKVPKFGEIYSGKEDVKVVSRMELYRPGEIVPLNIPTHFIQDHEMQDRPPSTNFHGFGQHLNHGTEPQINFAPVINVVAGDNSGYMAPPSEPVNSNNNNMESIMDPIMEPMIKPITVREPEQKQEPATESGTNPLNDTSMDFSKLIIKKV